MDRITTNLLATLFAAFTITHSAIGQADVKDITPQKLSAQIAHTVVIDVNEADNYTFAHIPGAKLLAYDAIKPEDLPADKSIPLVFYCWSPECPAADLAAKTAVSLGHTDVAYMPAGITGWQDAGLPTEP